MAFRRSAGQVSTNSVWLKTGSGMATKVRTQVRSGRRVEGRRRSTIMAVVGFDEACCLRSSPISESTWIRRCRPRLWRRRCVQVLQKMTLPHNSRPTVTPPRRAPGCNNGDVPPFSARCLGRSAQDVRRRRRIGFNRTHLGEQVLVYEASGTLAASRNNLHAQICAALKTPTLKMVASVGSGSPKTRVSCIHGQYHVCGFCSPPTPDEASGATTVMQMMRRRLSIDVWADS